MSGFEHYERELADVDHEIFHYAAVCGIDPSHAYELANCLNAHHDTWAGDKARESLHGLLMLRVKLETEMLEQGLTPPPLVSRNPANPA